MATEKKSSHLAFGLVLGTALGAAAAAFLSSKKGKLLTKDVEASAKKLQTKMMKKLKETKNLTKEAYQDIIDDMMKQYVKTKEIAQDQVPEIRAFLIKKWKDVDSFMKEQLD